MNESIDRWRRTFLIAMVLSALIAIVPLLMGSAVEKAPQACRGFEFSAATTPVQSGATSLINFEVGFGPTASVLVTNDEASTGSDLIVAFSSTTAVIPSSTAATTSFRLRPGDKLNFDGRWTRCALLGATANVTSRVIATY